MYENMGMAVADQTQISAVTPGSPADPSRVIVEGYSPIMTMGGGALLGYYFYKKNPIMGAIVGAVIGLIGGRMIKGFTPLPMMPEKEPEAGQEAEKEEAF